MEDLLPLQMLRNYSRDFPRAWRQIASMREGRGKDLPFWPDWCYCPIAGSVAIVTEGREIRDVADIIPKIEKHPPAIMAALAAWRVTKGIYRFDEDLLGEIISMPLEGNLPAEVFLSLPEWAIWVDIPDSIKIGPPEVNPGGDFLKGFFTHLEYDVNDSRKELRIVGVFQGDEGPHRIHFIGIHIGGWSLAEGVERAYLEGARHAESLGLQPPETVDDLHKKTVDYLTPLVNMVLYICSTNADFGEAGKPKHPSRLPTRKGKIQTATEARMWDIGVRVGPVLKQARMEAGEAGEKDSGSTHHASPRPHYRRAHWHHFWTGPRNNPEERKLILKWLPPTPVGLGDMDDDGSDNQPVVIRPIK